MSGDLERLDVAPDGGVAAGVTAEGHGSDVRASAPGGGTLNARGSRQEAILTFNLDVGMTAGFLGVYQYGA